MCEREGILDRLMDAWLTDWLAGEGGSLATELRIFWVKSRLKDLIGVNEVLLVL